MRSAFRTVIFYFVLGLGVWFLSAFLQYTAFFEGSLWQYLVADPPPHELFLRAIMLAAFLALGLIMAGRHAVRRERETAQEYLSIAGVVMLALDQQGRVTLINRKGCEVLGCREDEIVGRDWFQSFVPERLRDEVRRVHGRLMAGDVAPAEYFENPVLARHGQERMIAWHNTVLRDARGRIAGTLSSGSDVTERNRAEDALRRSEETTRSLLDAISDAAFLMEPGGTVLTMNQELARRLGLSPEEILGHPIYDFLPPDVAAERRAHIQEVAATGQPAEFEDTREGKIIHNRIYPVRDASGAVSRLAVVAGDVTERRQIERALRESEQRFRDLFEGSPDAVFVEDYQGRVLDVNPAACRLHGLSRSELIGRNVRDLVPADWRDQVLRDFPRWISGGLTDYAGCSLASDGRAVPVSIRCSRIYYYGRPALLFHVRSTGSSQVRSL